MAAIEIESLTKDYGEVLANDDVTFSVEDGEIFGYLGPNGAGKTTTIRILLGLISPTAGTARVLGHDVTVERELLAAKRRLGYLPDDPAFDESATGREVLDLHASIKGGSRRDELLSLFDPPLDRPVRDYSRGNVQKLALVTTFMHDPDLVILDEPTTGLDPLMKQRFARFLREEREAGLTAFFSSHVLGEVRRLCDRVGIIRNGRIVTIEPVEALLDRSGKVVRVRGEEPIPLEVIDIDGVYDVEQTVEAISGETPPDGTFTECTVTFTGDINELVGRLSAYRLHDLSIEEAPLEDVFMRFYGENESIERAERERSQRSSTEDGDEPERSLRDRSGDDAVGTAAAQAADDPRRGGGDDA